MCWLAFRGSQHGKEGMAKKLDSGERRLLTLVRKECDASGWAQVSDVVMQVVSPLPKELAESEYAASEMGGRVRLTPLGNSIVDAMVWL